MSPRRFIAVCFVLLSVCAPAAHAQAPAAEGWAFPSPATPGKRLDIAVRIYTPARLAYFSTDDALLDPSIIVGALGPCSGAGLGAVCNVDGEDYRRLVVRLVPRQVQGCGDVLLLSVALDAPEAAPIKIRVPLVCMRVLMPMAQRGDDRPSRQ